MTDESKAAASTGAPGRRWVRARGVVARRVAGEVILVPVDVAGAEPGSFFVLNGSGELLWSLLEEPQDVEHMARHLIAHYAIDLDTARRDAARFVERLVDCGALRAHEGT
jgi:hypothetical protein